MTLQPSYQQGFSPRDYEPLYPQLWSGCVGAWAPCLGPTGTVLRDHSGYGNHGTLTNMDPGSDWVTSGGKGALDFDGSNDNVTITMSPIKTNDFSICLWLNPRVLANYKMWFSSTDFYWYFASLDRVIAFDTASNSIFRSGNVLNTNVWQHVVAIRKSSNMRLFLNGIDRGVSTSDSFNQQSSSFCIGSWANNNTLFFDGQLDDIRIYNRALTEQEIRLLASERGIAYKQRIKRRFSQQATGSGSRRLRLLTGLQ